MFRSSPRMCRDWGGRKSPFMPTARIPIPDSIRQRVLARLSQIESEHDVQTLFAVESGSRAWDFASVNSDFDVRFVYVRQRDWYLTLHEGRDVIETPIEDDLDIQGWDVRKALRLFEKSNPPLNEWLVSPHIYLEQGIFAARLREIAAEFYSPIGVGHHYLHMAKREFHGDFYKGDEVVTKKYLYVMRPLLIILWLRTHQTIPPISMVNVLNEVAIPDDVRAEINTILEAKRSGMETRRGPKHPVLGGFIRDTFIEAEEFCAQAPKRKADSHVLNQIFRDILTSRD